MTAPEARGSSGRSRIAGRGIVRSCQIRSLDSLHPQCRPLAATHAQGDQGSFGFPAAQFLETRQDQARARRTDRMAQRDGAAVDVEFVEWNFPERPLGEIPLDKLNVNGGAVALGHPVGATGARLVLTSLKELRRRKAKRALVTLCVGGGQGAALWVERI